jgi:hypothetical protein
MIFGSEAVATPLAATEAADKSAVLICRRVIMKSSSIFEYIGQKWGLPIDRGQSEAVSIGASVVSPNGRSQFLTRIAVSR